MPFSECENGSELDFFLKPTNLYPITMSDVLTGDDGLGMRQPLQHMVYQPHIGTRLQVAHTLAQDRDEHRPYLRLQRKLKY